MMALVLYSYLAGFTVILGGLAALYFEHHQYTTHERELVIHSMVAFGGGIILSAVALVLIPQGIKHQSLWSVLVAFIAGAIVFACLDSYIEKKGGQAGNLMAMVMDFIPESIALGALFVGDPDTAILLAIFIALQNLPEAFNAFRELVQSGLSVKKTLIIFVLLSFCGVIAASIGHFFLQDKPTVTALLMVFASAGILYLLFNDIAPEAKLKNSPWPSLAASMGFLVGVVGELSIHGT